MNLAARLDRLRSAAGRGDTPRTDPGARTGSTGANGPGPGDAGEELRCAPGPWPGFEPLADGLLLRSVRVELPCCDAAARLDALPGASRWRSPDWVYIDTETTGLSGGVGNLAFLVGLARYREPGVLMLHQYLMAGFAAEAAMLSRVAAWLGCDAVLVSYNGRSFDIPVLAGRMRLQRVEHAIAAHAQLDLMHAVRRAYRRAWPDCRLQTAERHLLGLVREHDLPGAAAPAAWRAWLHTRQRQPLLGVLRHNRQDVVSLALLHHRLVATYAGQAGGDVDLAAVGSAWRAVGEEDRAVRVWECARDALDHDALLQLAAAYRRRGDWPGAAAIWRRLQRVGDPTAALELSKYHEHRTRDYRRALDFARQAPPAQRTARVQRLLGKLERSCQLPLLAPAG